MMKVATIQRHGGPQAFQIRYEAFPVPKDDEVVIHVLATYVNKIDVWRTEVEVELPQDWNHVPGIECTGKIVKVGKNVQEWKEGDEICALLNGGGFADKVVVRATQVLPLPLDNSFFCEGALLPQATCTTWEAIIRLAKLSANMTLLVYERCGKICDLAVQLAKSRQARVIVARDGSTSIKKDDSMYIKKLFSKVKFVDANSSCFVEDVLKATEREGVDVILDCDISVVHKATALKVRGKIVVVDLYPKSVSTVNFFPLSSANAVLHVVDRMWWTPEYVAEIVLDMRKNLWPQFKDGSLMLPIFKENSKSYFLSRVNEARIGDVITPI